MSAQPSGQPLVTGGAGFVGRHLLDGLRSAGAEPVAPSQAELDLLDADAVREAVARTRPSAVFHLAAQASVPFSWRQPGETIAGNVEMVVNLLDAVRSESPETRVLLAGSGELYGPPQRIPVEEDHPVHPQNPYAVSKAATDMLGAVYAEAYGLAVVRTRAFNHAGPGQSELYALGTFTRQVAAAEVAGAGEVTLKVGNIDTARDFTDVRDVVRAYLLAVEQEPGAFNVCSGRTVSLSDLLEMVARASEIEVHWEVDPERLRPNDIPEVRGSPERLRAATGWEPEIPLERTVADALAHWREQLR